jgi:hypothetical protein
MNCTEAGKLGAIARNKKLSPEERKAISIKANLAKKLKRQSPLSQ